jgi:hypothetical protein
MTKTYRVYLYQDGCARAEEVQGDTLEYFANYGQMQGGDWVVASMVTQAETGWQAEQRLKDRYYEDFVED